MSDHAGRAFDGSVTYGRRVAESDFDKSEFFENAYWTRVLELAVFLDRDGIHQAAANSSRRHRRALKRIEPLGRWSLDYVDAVAKRFALWSTRRNWHWDGTGFSEPEAPGGLMWHLDVELRRRLELKLAADDQLDADQAAASRGEAEKTAAGLAEHLDFSPEADDDYDLGLVAEHFRWVCEDIDDLLNQAGAPSDTTETGTDSDE